MACSTAISILLSALVPLPRGSASPPRATSIISVPRTSSDFTPTRSAGSSASPCRASTFGVMAGHDTGDKGPGNGAEHTKELVDLHGCGIGDEDDVLVPDRKAIGEMIGVGFGEIEPIDDGGDPVPGSRRHRLAERMDNRYRLVAEEEYALGVGQIVAQPLGFRQCLAHCYC